MKNLGNKTPVRPIKRSERPLTTSLRTLKGIAKHHGYPGPVLPIELSQEAYDVLIQMSKNTKHNSVAKLINQAVLSAGEKTNGYKNR